MKISVENIPDIKFSFEFYTQEITRVLPQEDMVGISNIFFTDSIREFDKKARDALACSAPREKGKQSDIYLSLNNITEEKIPKYLFNEYPEIASLLLSEIICHEVGHHVHNFLRHGVGKTKKQSFADKYSRAGYLRYFLSRKSKILRSYLFASLNIFKFSTEDRRLFALSRNELIDWSKKSSGQEIKLP